MERPRLLSAAKSAEVSSKRRAGCRARLLLAVALTAFCVITAAGARPEVPVQNPRFGFAAGGNLHSFAPPTLRRYLDLAKASHAGWIRIDLNWDVIQHRGRNRYN